MNNDKLNIFDYTDYRSFLSDFVEWKKIKSQYFSLGSWSKKLGISSPSTLSMVLSGKREAGPKLAKKIAEYFSFSNEERLYFFELVYSSKKNELKKSITFLGYTDESKIESEKSTEFDMRFDWDTYIIREVLASGVSATLESFNRSLLRPLSEKKLCEIKRKLDENSDTPSCENNSSKSEKLSLHKDIMDFSCHAVLKAAEKDKHFHSALVSIDSKRFSEAKEELRLFQMRFIDKYASSNPSSICQLSTQFFKITSLE